MAGSPKDFMSGLQQQVGPREAFLLACASSNAIGAMDHAALRALVEGMEKVLFPTGGPVMDLKPLWPALKEKGVDVTAFYAAALQMKAWEPDLRISVVLPDDVEKLGAGAKRKYQDKCTVQRSDLVTLLQKSNPRFVPTNSGPPPKTISKSGIVPPPGMAAAAASATPSSPVRVPSNKGKAGTLIFGLVASLCLLAASQIFWKVQAPSELDPSLLAVDLPISRMTRKDQGIVLQIDETKWDVIAESELKKRLDVLRNNLGRVEAQRAWLVGGSGLLAIVNKDPPTVHLTPKRPEIPGMRGAQPAPKK